MGPKPKSILHETSYFHKTLPRSSVFVNWFSVRFYEMDFIKKCSYWFRLFISFPTITYRFLFSINYSRYRVKLIIMIWFRIQFEIRKVKLPTTRRYDSLITNKMSRILSSWCISVERQLDAVQKRSSFFYPRAKVRTRIKYTSVHNKRLIW